MIFRNVRLEQTLSMAMETNLVAIALVVDFVIITQVPVNVFLDFWGQDANTKQTYHKFLIVWLSIRALRRWVGRCKSEGIIMMYYRCSEDNRLL